MPVPFYDYFYYSFRRISPHKLSSTPLLSRKHKNPVLPLSPIREAKSSPFDKTELAQLEKLKKEIEKSIQLKTAETKPQQGSLLIKKKQAKRNNTSVSLKSLEVKIGTELIKSNILTNLV